MNFHAYYPIDVVNGPGTRATLFVSGCEHKCVNCYNRTTWNPKSGQLFDDQTEQKILTDLASSEIPRQGLSLTGGDPLFAPNIEPLLRLVKRVKQELPEKDIWCWTGYSHKQLNADQLALVSYCDVLIDGPFIDAKKDATLVWRGSSNQQIIKVKAWLKHRP